MARRLLTHSRSESRRLCNSLVPGFTMVELLITLVIAATLTAIALPMVISSVARYQRNSAVSAVTGAIRAARYSAIYQGNSFRLTFNHATSSYQLSSAPTNTTVFANVGQSVPLSELARKRYDARVSSKRLGKARTRRHSNEYCAHIQRSCGNYHGDKQLWRHQCRAIKTPHTVSHCLRS